MARRSGHRPAERLVPRPARGVMPDQTFWEQLEAEPVEVPEVLQKRLETIDERFEAWLAKNPAVLDNFVRLARQAKAAGRTKIGAKMIAEVLRWDSFIAGDDDGYKLNNVYVSRLVRRAVEQHPDLVGLFEMRRLHRAS